MMLPCVANLTRYLEREWSGDDDFPWNKSTCLAVVSYAIKKKPGSSATISSLESTAEQYLNEVDVVVKKNRMHTFSQLFVDSFIPEAQIHFTVPELVHLSDMDSNLERNEILAAFLDFLVQILHREANVGPAGKQRYAPLQKALLFLLAVLGDRPFDCNTQHAVLKEQVEHLLVESEALANQAGWIIYSCIFSIRLVKDDTFYAKINALLKRFEILNVEIKQHCINFSELPIQTVPRSNVVDSFFIIHSLVNDLGNLTSPKFILVKEQITMLHDELITSQALLKVIEAQQVESLTKEPLVQIRNLAYEAEYLINSHVAGNIHAWYIYVRLPSITQEIKFSRERLQQIKEIKPREVMMHGGEISEATSGPAVDDNIFVELQDNTTERILSDLVGKSKSRQIISIFGMPGLGKTTIANKLYHNNSVPHYFDRRAWCVVSQTYNVRSLMINILTHIDRELKKDEILKKSDAELGVDIHKSLKQRRYLIVLDDVWHCKAWDDLKRYFPNDGNGSRVILTSRIKDAAPRGSIYHTLPLFSKDQCWYLLEKKIFQKESCPPELVSIGKGIASKCSGIPLAVTVTAGILASLKRERDAWKRVENKLNTFLLDGTRKILELSYEHLPHYLKPCFTYFAAFPEDVEISVNKLTWRWMAEGFMTQNEGKSREQIAEEYLLQLINRSLVTQGRRRADGGIKTCRIHDLLRDICVTKANEENFLNSNNELAIYEKHQRSYLSSTSNTDSRPFGLHCRSIIGGLPDRSSCFQTRALLKVLDIRPNKFQKYEGTSFDLPIQLRYLGVNHLPELMTSKLDHLEVINVVNSSQIKVPSIILRMKKLKHLLIRKTVVFEEDDDYISGTTNLRTLLHFYIDKKSDEAILRDSPHLQTLKFIVGGKTIIPDLSFLEELETLKIVFEEVSWVRGYKVSNLNFPSTIRNLCLIYTLLPFDKMSLLGKLPKLCVLRLEDNAVWGSTWETSDDEFRELKYLKIMSRFLEQWITCSEHFPKLEQLVLQSLGKSVEIPSDFVNIDTLKRIDVIYCPIKACLSALQIEQEQRDYGNEDLQVNIKTNFWTKEDLTAFYKDKMEYAKNVEVMEGDCSEMYELSSIICTRERDFLFRNNCEQVKVTSLKGKVVGIYFFSASPSCQLFTQKLVKLYNEMKKYGHFEIVQVPWGSDAKYFMANFSEDPWLAIPLIDSNTINKLIELFQVTRVPYLVILDENRKVLTDEGVKIVEEGSEMELQEDEKERIKQQSEDKWNHSLECLLVSKTRDYVIDNNGTKLQVSNFVGKTIMLLFVNSEFPQCTTFTRKLVNVYQEINKKYNNSVEVIFISDDEDQFQYDEFFATMPWLALPFGDNKANALRLLYMVSHIPTLIIIGPNGKTVTVDGSELVRCYGAEAYPFTSERVKEIESENDKMAELIWPNKIVNTGVCDHVLGLAKYTGYGCALCDAHGCNWMYCCPNCFIRIHPRCALGDDYNVEESWPKKVKKVHESKGIDENDEMAKLWPNKMNIEVHEHELCLIKHIHRSYICDGCDELGGYDWSYYCADCDFDLHPMCVLGDDYKADVVECWTKKDPEEQEAMMNYSLESLLITKFRDFVINSSGEKIQVSSLVGKTTMLFFAAHWCPPCQSVLPKLVQRYQERNEKQNNFVEVIFVSSDENELSFDKFFAMMPWLALPFEDYRINNLIRFFKVKDIPILITIEPTGKAIVTKGWELASYPGAEAYPFTYEWVQIQTKAQKMVIFWPKKVTKNLHDHELCLVNQILYDCDGCHEVGCNWSYKCELCVFNLHPSCALGDSKGC